MANIYDLKTAVVILTGADSGTDLDLGEVPAGKQRFVVGVKIHCPRGIANTVNLGDAAAADGALTNTLFKQKNDDTFKYPENPNMDTPIFSIPGEQYLGAVTDALVVDTELTVLYYDE